MTSFRVITMMLFFLISTLLHMAYVNGAQDPKCLQPMDPGPCRMSLERYYYNSQTKTCQTFKFGGCKGNDNKFGFKQTCEEACLEKSPAKSATSKPSLASTSSSAKPSTLSSPTTTTATTKQQTNPITTQKAANAPATTTTITTTTTIRTPANLRNSVTTTPKKPIK